MWTWSPRTPRMRVPMRMMPRSRLPWPRPHGPPPCFPHCGPHPPFGPHPHWEVLAKQDNTTESASDVNLSAEAGWPGPWGPGPGHHPHWHPHPWGPWGPGPHWPHPHGPPPCFPHCGPHPPFGSHPHWEVLAKQDNSTESASDVNLSAEAGWPGPPPGPWAPHPWAPHPWAPHPWAPYPWHPHPWAPHWEVLAKHDNSTESASAGDVSLSEEAATVLAAALTGTASSTTEAPRRLRR